MIKVIDWIKNYRGFIGPLNDNTASDWLEAIQSNIPRLTQRELDEAVAVICGKERDARSAKPGAYEIMREIMAMRGTSGIQTPNNVKYYDGNMVLHKTTMAELKALLNRRPHPEEAWEIICTPLMVEQCRELERYSVDHGIDYDKFVPKVDLVRQLANKLSVVPF